MNTLREVGTFVGIPEDPGPFGGELPSTITLGYVRDLLAGTHWPYHPQPPGARPFSMQEAIRQLETLPPIELEANVIGSTQGTEPFVAGVRIGSSPGVIISTRIFYETGGMLLSSSENVGAAGGDVDAQLSPGAWTATVRRTGIGATGYKNLQKTFHFLVRRQPEPPAPHVPTPTRPTIQATHRREGDNAIITVTGQGFLANQPRSPQGITIRVVDKADFSSRLPDQYTGSDEAGAMIRREIDPFDIRLVIQNPFDNKRRVVVSATDSRKDPNSVPANGPLWSVGVEIEF